ncbi:ABC transporter substrate-binding protein [Prochlorothrix hollandica]|uniref:ABC transporter substrate-binding protein n=1 Tax=Prochlorothrix hollandica TaxID=1223 RepID=UPI0003466BBA|nr:ABC transporter substrate-binding protein [Prochlorothrix hollandica]
MNQFNPSPPAPKAASASRFVVPWPGAWFQRWQRFWLVMLGCCLLVVSCQGSDPSTVAPGETGVDAARITLGTTSKIRTLDPADSYEIISGNLLYNLGDRLYTNKPGTTDLEPQLATALPTISADGLTYTIPLREGVSFHDGTAFNAEAMAFSLQRFMDNGGQPSFLLTNVVESVAASAEFELTITLKSPFAAFPSLLSFAGLCAVSPTAYAKAQEFQPDTFVGTGPYRLVEVTTDGVKIDRVEDYWGTPAQNPGVNLQIFSSAANLFNALRTGSVDLAYQSLDPEQVKTLQEEATAGSLQVASSEGNGIHYLSVNVLSAPLDQLPVRQALAAAVDRQILSDRVFQGQVQPLYSLVPSSLSASVPAFQDRYGDSNPTLALDLLKQAGFSAENPAQIDFWYRSNISSNVLAATTLKAIIEDRLGGALVLNLQGVESATAYENLDKGAYPLFLLDWVPDFLDADNYLEPFLTCSEGSATTGCVAGASQYQGSFYYNDRVNQLISQQRQELDPAQRQAQLTEIQTIVATDVPFIPLWSNREFLFGQSSVQNMTLEPTQQVPFSPLQKQG